MFRFHHSLAFSLILTAITALLIGCSEDSTLYSGGGSAEDDVSFYFPLQTGKAVDFVIKDQANQNQLRERFLIGNPVTLIGQQGYRWLSYDLSYPTYVDTGFMQIRNNALYYYDTPFSLPEKLLEAPVEVGRYWLRFDPTELSLGDTNNYIDDLGDGQKDEDTTTFPGGNNHSGGIVGKNYPTFGSNYFMITAIEDIQLEDGNIYRNCVCVENRSGSMVNRYWYAPGAGLVKYSIDATSVTYPGGQIVGEIAPPSNF